MNSSKSNLCVCFFIGFAAIDNENGSLYAYVLRVGVILQGGHLELIETLFTIIIVHRYNHNWNRLLRRRFDAGHSHRDYY